MIKTTPFIFASGLGTRLRPLTENTPKPLLPIAKDLTILDLNIRKLISLEFNKVYINYSYKKELFEELATKYNNQIQVELVDDKNLTGQAGVLRDNLDKFGKDEVIFGINGDTYVDTNIRSLLQQAKLENVQMFYSPSITELPHTLITQNNILVGIKRENNNYFYGNHITDFTLINNLGLYLIPVEIIKLVQDTIGFLGVFGNDDLFDVASKNNKNIYCHELKVKNFLSFNTPEEYTKVKNIVAANNLEK